MIHRKKNRPALQRRDILTVSLASFYLFLFFYFLPSLLRSTSTQVLVTVLFLLFNTARFSSKYFFAFFSFFFFLRSLSTQLSYLVVSHFLVLSVTAFCYGDFFYGLC